ncbi:MAG: Glutamine transport ATP-binding protein GlnQ [Synergistetes bacterium ADurb.BinA166]|nr:MAG: Glutamine transport ATP-binding protein GlnQ [Synergistetes bacterium ADurb.BinA166]
MSPYEVKDTLISIEDVSLSLGDVPILKNVNGSVKDIVRPGCTQGQIVGILGPSGIGKTQLSRILSGLQEPTSGRVSILDGSGNMVPVRAGLVGVVAQNYPLLRHRTVLGNLTLSASQAGASRSDSRSLSMEKLSVFGLSDKADLYPSQLSGGQRQRVAIAQQLLCSERYVVMDEPFSGLDPLMKDKTCDLISKVACLNEHNTIFVVSHDIRAVASISDSLWLIGRDMADDGTPIHGSRIQIRYDLASMGLAWRPDIGSVPGFLGLCEEIRSRFSGL